MRTTRRLSPEEESALVARYQRGDSAAGGALVAAYERLIRARIFRFAQIGVDTEDLLQEARAGFLHGVSRFDPNKKRALSAYATHWAVAAARRYSRDHRRNVRLPDHLFGRRPGNPPIETRRLLRSAEYLLLEASIADERIDVDEEEPALLHVLVDDGPGPEDSLIEAVETRIGKELCAQAFAMLSPQARDVLRRRTSDEPETLAEIGVTYGVSRERIRQVESKALALLRCQLPRVER